MGIIDWLWPDDQQPDRPLRPALTVRVPKLNLRQRLAATRPAQAFIRYVDDNTIFAWIVYAIIVAAIIVLIYEIDHTPLH